MTDTKEPDEQQSDPREKDQEEIQKPDHGLFVSRMTKDEVQIGPVVFEIRALPATLYSTLTDNNMNYFGHANNGALTIDIFRYGVTGIRNLTDEDNEPVKIVFQDSTIAGAKRQMLSQSIIAGLPIDVVQLIATKIAALSRWGIRDAERLGFTKELLGGSNAPENTSDTQTEPTS